MEPLTLARVTQALAEQVHQVLDRQIVDPSHPDLGAIVQPAWGVADPGGTALAIAGFGCLYLAQVKGQPGSEIAPGGALLRQATLAIDYLLRAQRPSGLIDLLSCNYDSSPDAGFAVQRLCPLIELGRPMAGHDPAWAAFLEKVETFVQRAVPGILNGGFHTPNHRWVIASALAYAHSLYPDLEVHSVIESYLAEGFDVDAEGAFIEHSVGVYDAVCDRSLLLLVEHWNCTAALEAAHANLDFDLYLLHADGTAETGLSRRQDYGTSVVPVDLAAPYLHCAYLESEPLFAHAAQVLYAKAKQPHLDALNWLVYVLLKHGEPSTAFPELAPALPSHFARLFPLSGIWRVRNGPLSATLFRGTTRLLTMRYGRAEVSSVKISQSYFGVGQFTGDALEMRDGAAILRSECPTRAHRPGYDLPLGRPVAPERWKETVEERPYHPFPPCTSTLAVRQAQEGLELRYQTLDGFPGVAAQMAIDFTPGGIWETNDLCTSTQPGQVLFLKRGYGTMRYGNDAIWIGPGAVAHRMWHMRDAETAPDSVRVLLTFFTPVDHTVSMHGTRA